MRKRRKLLATLLHSKNQNKKIMEL